MHGYLGNAIASLGLLHVLAAFFFILAHGPSVFVTWQLRREREPARIAALLDLSGAASPASWAALVALGVTGFLLAAAGHVWGRPWLWGSIVVLLAVAVSMSLLAARPFNHARSAAGLKWFDGKRTRPATGHVDAAALDTALGEIRARVPLVMWTGAVGLAILVWLMVARPG